MSLGKRLKSLRQRRTQQTIADLVGVSRASYCHYENNHVQPDNETLNRLAEVYQVSIDYLLGRESATVQDQILNEIVQKYKIDLTNPDSRKRLEKIIALVFSEDPQ
jgi:transcriptional regulator with XRE-family HTH domain